MRADIHDDPEHNRSKQRSDTLMQDRICRIDENLLHRAAGPYIGVRLGKARVEHSESASPQTAASREARSPERLRRATNGNRWAHRDAMMILVAYPRPQGPRADGPERI